jgi:eukaryotic-like serine/threonine-protein kinase
VSVPSSWARDVSLAGWVPPGSPDGRPAIAVGNRPDWRADGQGVFLGIVPVAKLPRKLPQHPECGAPGKPVTGDYQSDPMITEVTHGCGGVVVERVVQVSSTALLWIQVRSHDEETADDVLASVHTQGSLG